MANLEIIPVVAELGESDCAEVPVHGHHGHVDTAPGGRVEGEVAGHARVELLLPLTLEHDRVYVHQLGPVPSGREGVSRVLFGRWKHLHFV